MNNIDYMVTKFGEYDLTLIINFGFGNQIQILLDKEKAKNLARDLREAANRIDKIKNKQ